MRMRKVLVTGGAGFIGSHLCETLLQRGDEVFVLDDLSTGQIENIAHLQNRKAFHFTLGSILQRLGDAAGARRAYRNAHDLCTSRPTDEVVPLSDGEHAGRLSEAAAVQLAVLDATSEVIR